MVLSVKGMTWVGRLFTVSYIAQCLVCRGEQAQWSDATIVPWKEIQIQELGFWIKVIHCVRFWLPRYIASNSDHPISGKDVQGLVNFAILQQISCSDTSKKWTNGPIHMGFLSLTSPFSSPTLPPTWFHQSPAITNQPLCPSSPFHPPSSSNWLIQLQLVSISYQLLPQQSACHPPSSLFTSYLHLPFASPFICLQLFSISSLSLTCLSSQSWCTISTQHGKYPLSSMYSPRPAKFLQQFMCAPNSNICHLLCVQVKKCIQFKFIICDLISVFQHLRLFLWCS